jgi:ribonuclease-3
LELLGDAVLDLVATEELLARHPDAGEGQVTFMRQGVVSRAACARVSRAAGLPERMAALAPRSGPELAQQVASDAVAEAVIGAAWLDLGADPTREAVLRAFTGELDAVTPAHRDAKSRLQEIAAARGDAVAYRVTSRETPEAPPRFTGVALVGGDERGRGEGPSKQAAEQAAAEAALAGLEGDAC